MNPYGFDNLVPAIITRITELVNWPTLLVVVGICFSVAFGEQIIDFLLAAIHVLTGEYGERRIHTAATMRFKMGDGVTATVSGVAGDIVVGADGSVKRFQIDDDEGLGDKEPSKTEPEFFERIKKLTTEVR